MSFDETNSRSGNRLLDALPVAERRRILPRLEKVPLTVKQLLAMEDQCIEHAYFPLNCVISMLARTDAETFVEVATIGREGMLGVPMLLGAETMAHRACCQIPGECLRMPAGDFRRETERSGPLTAILYRYLEMLMVQLAQAGACNSRHTIEQRCARWLLMCRDRVDEDEFPLTQEFLCQMLSVRRATVSEIASKFQKAGYIEYVRGKMTILDREGLARTACECYRILRDEYNRPLNPPEGGGLL